LCVEGKNYRIRSGKVSYICCWVCTCTTQFYCY